MSITGAAEEVLNNCTVSDPDHPSIDDEQYSVIFNYEFIEDTIDKKSERTTQYEG